MAQWVNAIETWGPGQARTQPGLTLTAESHYLYRTVAV